jgi:hypothetical protein
MMKRLATHGIAGAFVMSTTTTVSAAAPKKDWMTFELQGVHPFVGIGLMGGPALPFSANAGKPGRMDGSFLFSLRGGIYAGRNELALEISPMTYLVGTQLSGTSFQLAFNYTGLVPLFESPKLGVYWPFRIGYGFVAANMPANAAFMQLRIDVFGVAFRVGHVMLDFSLPSFRYLYSPGDTTGNAMFFSWLPGMHASYLF